MSKQPTNSGPLNTFKSSVRRRAGGAVTVVLVVLVALIATILTLLNKITVDTDKLAEYCEEYKGVNQTPLVETSGNTGRFDSAEQRAIIKQIVDIGNARNMGYRGIMLALMVAMQESGIRNLKYGHLDSYGIYQQRPSQGWGTREQILDPEYAIGKFYDALEGVQGWQSMSYLDAALAVQRPSREAYLSANNYFPGWEPVASNILGDSDEDVQTVTTSVEAGDLITQLCDRVLLVYGQEQSKLEKILLAALSRRGDEYEWGEPFDGGEFICWAFDTEHVDVPCTPSEHGAFVGDPKLGVKVDFIPGDDIRSGDNPLIAGDVVLNSDDPDASKPEDATSIGMFVGGQGSPEFKIATINTKVGPGFETRLKRARELAEGQFWDIVGFQETELAPIFKELHAVFKDSKYAVYPPITDKIYRNGPNSRSIAYNTERFEPVIDPSTGKPKVDEILFKRMEEAGEPQPAHAPIIWLQDKVTGQQIIVANTHTSAFKRFTQERKEAGEAYAEKMAELKAEGLPIFFTGDFNSGYWMDQDGFLPTWQGDRDNLTYCQLTVIQEDGKPLMHDARDVYDGIAMRDGGYCPRKPGEGPWSIDHIYVTPGVEVSKYGEISRETTLSDHDANWASVSVPGASQNPSDNSLGEYVGVGLGTPSNFTYATYNIHGSNHPTKVPASERIKTTAQLILDRRYDAIALQEVRPDQRDNLMKLIGGQYDIYPREPIYGSSQLSANPIIWDSSKYELVMGRAVPTLRYFNGQTLSFPLVKLKSLKSGAAFWMGNKHNPAHEEYEQERYLNDVDHAELMEELTREGLPVLFGGDFNSGPYVRQERNTTYGNKCENLAWYIWTKSGTMRNAYDAWKGYDRVNPDGSVKPCPLQAADDPDVRSTVDLLFASSDVDVTDFDVTWGNTGSDHPVVSASVQLPGMETSSEGSKTQIIQSMEVNPDTLIGALRYTLTLPEVSVTGTYTLPIAKGVYTITNTFGVCASYYQSCHTGLDFAAPSGTPIMAVTGGEIFFAGDNGAFGNMIKILAPDGTEWWYGHMGQFALEEGYVEAGQVIGYVGNTGNVYGSNGGYHLHLECRPNGGDPVDPFEVLKRQGLNP